VVCRAAADGRDQQHFLPDAQDGGLTTGHAPRPKLPLRLRPRAASPTSRLKADSGRLASYATWRRSARSAGRASSCRRPERRIPRQEFLAILPADHRAAFESATKRGSPTTSTRAQAPARRCACRSGQPRLPSSRPRLGRVRWLEHSDVDLAAWAKRLPQLPGRRSASTSCTSPPRRVRERPDAALRLHGTPIISKDCSGWLRLRRPK
jgi:hypothetical protein